MNVGLHPNFLLPQPVSISTVLDLEWLSSMLALILGVVLQICLNSISGVAAFR